MEIYTTRLSQMMLQHSLRASGHVVTSFVQVSRCWGISGSIVMSRNSFQTTWALLRSRKQKDGQRCG